MHGCSVLVSHGHCLGVRSRDVWGLYQDVRVRSHVSGSELAQTELYTFLNIVQHFHLTVDMREPVVKKKKVKVTHPRSQLGSDPVGGSVRQEI